MKRLPSVAALLLPLLPALCALPLAAQPQMYRCTDAAGRVGYQSQPCARGSRQAEPKLPALNVVPAAPRQDANPPGSKVPAEAAITFYYDPAEQPESYSAQQTEDAIRTALAAWSADCKVRLSYGGRAPARLPGTPQHVSIRWEPRYVDQRHPAHPGFGISGTGSLRDGIRLRPFDIRMHPFYREVAMLSTLTHEVGHVLGLGHNHEDPHSVMSYLRHDMNRERGPLAEAHLRELTPAEIRGTARPSAADYQACNLSMQAMFGTGHPPPPGAAAGAGRPRMSDREVLDLIERRRTQAEQAGR